MPGAEGTNYNEFDIFYDENVSFTSESFSLIGLIYLLINFSSPLVRDSKRRTVPNFTEIVAKIPIPFRFSESSLEKKKKKVMVRMKNCVTN